MYFEGFLNNPTTMIVLVVLMVSNLIQYANTPGKIIALITAIPGILIAIAFHEYAHAFVADKLGDDTPRRQGRLTLNPFKHIDVYGMILLLFVGFGWGKPVEVNPNNFKRTISIKKGNALVSLAGPVMNFILAIIFSIILALYLRFGFIFAITNPVGHTLALIIRYIISINVGLGVFNLIPLPPLDGSKILVALLPEKARAWYTNNERLLYIVFIIVWVTPIATMLISPIIGGINKFLLSLIYTIAGKILI